MTSTEIAYDRTSGEYAMYVDGALVGFAANYHDASIALDRMSDDPPDGPPAIGDGPGEDNPPPDTKEHRLSVNRVVLNVVKALHIPCRFCKGDHLTQHCAKVRALLFAPEIIVLDLDYTPAPWAA
jgi:hypothetical protein